MSVSSPPRAPWAVSIAPVSDVRGGTFMAVITASYAAAPSAVRDVRRASPTPAGCLSALRPRPYMQSVRMTAVVTATLRPCELLSARCRPAGRCRTDANLLGARCDRPVLRLAAERLARGTYRRSLLVQAASEEVPCAGRCCSGTSSCAGV